MTCDNLSMKTEDDTWRAGKMGQQVKVIVAGLVI